LSVSKVFHEARLGHLRIKSTQDLKGFEGVIEQQRPREALELGIRVNQRNFHIYVSGHRGTGKMTTTLRLLNRDAPMRPVPPDLLFVHNFDNSEEPWIVALPPGQGVRFRRDIEKFIIQLRHDIPDLYHSKEHQERIQVILNRSMERENEAFSTLKGQAAKLDFLIRSTKQGITVLPIVKGKPMAQKEFADQPKKIRKRTETRRKKLDPILSSFFELTRTIEKEGEASIENVQRDMGVAVMEESVENLKSAHGLDPRILEYLAALMDDILEHLIRFLTEEGDEPLGNEAFLKTVPQYQVNLLVDNRHTEGAPVIIEDRPNFFNLFGRIDKKVEYGIYSTDHTMLKAGSIIKANGGFLVLNAHDLIAHAGVWEMLKATLRSSEVRIEELGEAHGHLSTSGMRPEAIPVEVKIILVGSHDLYDTLYRGDEDFRKLFRIKAEFDDVVDRTKETERAYAQFVAGVCDKDSLLPVTQSGLEALVEAGSRWAEHQNRLSLAFNDLASLVIEADDVARRINSKKIGRSEVRAAEEQREFHISYVRDRMFEGLDKNQILLNLDGTSVGSVNALSVLQDGPHCFGKPNRVTARAQAGSGGVLNVEREAHLSGQIHDKGMLVLTGYLGGQYGRHTTISASVSVCFEQNYGYIDGDSASMAELLAILSEVSGLPLRQDLAITGSVNQFGEVQPVGGVTEKIEGFHRICVLRGLTGTQGVAIPAANVETLMLPERIRKDIKSGKFSIYLLSHVDEAIALFFERPAGTWNGEKFRPSRSIHAKVIEQLKILQRLTDDTKGDDGKSR
jgi:lon-related putative ATP-dependent protease